MATLTCTSFVFLAEAEGQRTIQKMVPAHVSLRLAGVEQLYQEKRMIEGIGNVFVIDLFSNFKWVRSGGYFCATSTLRGSFLVSRTGDEG